ncbi:MAG: C45 family peptidase [Myxococcota bacterium]
MSEPTAIAPPPPSPTLEKIVLIGRTGDDIGAAHGSRWPREIAALAALRTRLALERGDFGSKATVRALASAHLPVLEAYDASLYAELCATAAAARVRVADLVTLNHYTDLRDISRSIWAPLVGPDPAADVDPGGCSVALLPSGPGQAVSGQTWDMHGTATPFVRMVEVRQPGHPTATLLTLTGCLGLAGMNEEGVAVLINNLNCTDARVGVVWGAVVRRMLRERTASAALDVLRETRFGSGHHYMVSDGREAFAVETTGQRVVELARGIAQPILHTNHCLIADLRPVEKVPPTSTTYARLSHLERRVALLDGPATAESMAALLSDHQGFPNSLCTHTSLATGNPDASDTCAAVVFDSVGRRLLAVAGCAVSGTWVETRPGDDDARPIARPTL